MAAPRHSRSDNSDEPWATEHWLGSRLAVEFPGRATFEVSRGEVVLVRDDCNDPDLLLQLFLHHVLPRVIALRGDLMLHAAGAVSSGGVAYLFLASAGTGKSTLVIGLVSDGWLLLDDDGIRLTKSSDGAFVAFPGLPQVGLLPDAAAAFVPELELGRPIASGSPKRRFALAGEQLRLADGPAPVGGICILERGGTEIGAERLGFAAALGEIARHGFHLADEPAAVPSQAFEHASGLAAANPVWRLTMPTGFDELKRVRTSIRDLDPARLTHSTSDAGPLQSERGNRHGTSDENRGSGPGAERP